MRRKTPLQRKSYSMVRHRPLTRRLRLPTSKPDHLLEKWYRAGIERSTWVCENCGCYIPHAFQWQQFSAQCHILAKEKYSSVRLVPENRLHLCAPCHSDFDASWHKASRMPVFALARLLLKTFRDRVIETLPPLLADA